LYMIHSDSTPTSHFWASGHIVVGHGYVSPSVGQQHGKLLYEQLQLQDIDLLFISYCSCKTTI
jgi:hypothetical protein